jgi:hypothetical protein
MPRRSARPGGSNMFRSVAKFIRNYLPVFLAAPLAAIVIIGYNMMELLEKYHPKVVQGIYSTVAAILLFCAFYLIIRVIRDIRAEEPDNPDDLWRNRRG